MIKKYVVETFRCSNYELKETLEDKLNQLQEKHRISFNVESINMFEYEEDEYGETIKEIKVVLTYSIGKYGVRNV